MRNLKQDNNTFIITWIKRIKSWNVESYSYSSVLPGKIPLKTLDRIRVGEGYRKIKRRRRR